MGIDRRVGVGVQGSPPDGGVSMFSGAMGA